MPQTSRKTPTPNIVTTTLAQRVNIRTTPVTVYDLNGNLIRQGIPHPSLHRTAEGYLFHPRESPARSEPQRDHNVSTVKTLSMEHGRVRISRQSPQDERQSEIRGLKRMPKFQVSARGSQTRGVQGVVESSPIPIAVRGIDSEVEESVIETSAPKPAQVLSKGASRPCVVDAAVGTAKSGIPAARLLLSGTTISDTSFPAVQPHTSLSTPVYDDDVAGNASVSRTASSDTLPVGQLPLISVAGTPCIHSAVRSTAADILPVLVVGKEEELGGEFIDAEGLWAVVAGEEGVWTGWL